MSDNTREIPLCPSDGQGMIRALFTVYGIVLGSGVVLLRHFALESGLPMNFDRSVFWAVNALTCTGFRASPNGLPEFSQLGLAIVYALMLAGSAIAMMIGGILTCRLARLPHSPARVIASTCFLMLAASVFGAGALMSSQQSFGESLFEATGAIANAGMSIGEVRSAEDWQVQLVLLPLAAIGGLGVPIVIEVFDRLIVHRPLSGYTRRMLPLAAVAWILCFFLLVAANKGLPWRENIVASWTYAINSRSLGADIPVGFGRVAWWMVAIFMMVGSVGGSAGGLRLGAISTLLRHGRTVLAGGRTPPVFGQAVAWVGIFCGLGLVLFLLLLSAEPDLASDRLLLMAAGAMGNTGISHEAVALSPRGLALLSAAMVAGHLLPLQFAGWYIQGDEPARP